MRRINGPLSVAATASQLHSRSALHHANPRLHLAPRSPTTTPPVGVSLPSPCNAGDLQPVPLRAAERSAPKYSQVGESRDSTGFVCFFPHHVLGGPHNFRVFSVFCLAFPALGVGQGDAEKSLEPQFKNWSGWD